MKMDEHEVDVHVLQAIMDQMKGGDMHPMEMAGGLDDQHAMNDKHPGSQDPDAESLVAEDAEDKNPDVNEDETDPRFLRLVMEGKGGNDPDEDGDDDSELVARL